MGFQPAAAAATPWVTYTPTFTGFGTPTAVSVWSRRIGDTLHLRGKFTSGTSTAVEGQMTLGFNGVNGGITADATKVPSIQYAGPAGQSVVGAFTSNILIESGVGYITFGLQNAPNASLTKTTGANFMASGTALGFMAEIPITGW